MAEPAFSGLKLVVGPTTSLEGDFLPLVFQTSGWPLLAVERDGIRTVHASCSKASLFLAQVSGQQEQNLFKSRVFGMPLSLTVRWPSCLRQGNTVSNKVSGKGIEDKALLLESREMQSPGPAHFLDFCVMFIFYDLFQVPLLSQSLSNCH